MACVLIGEHPDRYGLRPKYESPKAFDVVPLPKVLDLGIAARCAGVAAEVIHQFNPGLRAWCTPKDRPGFELRIPKGARETFLANLEKVEDWNPGPTLVRYKVKRGDTLGRIAVQNHTTVRALLEINKLRSPRLLRPGMTLRIRPGRPKPSHGKRRRNPA
ncbi:MAG: LysM peptidoglycan-binding domain-containing protein [Elusimicrobia bacterium]|nr:LysM peptidoglycan-binding domain-containing protein [Elusimicrobiota bacterium]